MTKSEFINGFKENCSDLTGLDSELVAEVLIQTMTDAILNQERIEIRGFGSFSHTLLPSRLARNPKTGAPVSIASQRKVRFKLGKDFRNRINPL